MKRTFFSILPFFLYILSSCSGITHADDAETLYMHLGAEPGTLNPVIATDAYASTINSHIYETLLDMDLDTLERIPDLAQSWTISPDKKRYRFKLKREVLVKNNNNLSRIKHPSPRGQ